MPWTLGDYLLIERLNQGGMADVYLAKTFGFSGADQTLAVKCIRPEVSEDPEFVRMFIDEAKLSVLLDHGNIAQTYELGRIGPTYFMAMEHVSGKDLRAVIDRAVARGLEIPLSLALHIAIQVCEGLDYAHRKTDPTGLPLHIVHRDVSPQNVLISYDGEVKIIDFGIAKAATQASRSQAGVLKGKYGYMSPEQVRGMAVDARSDVFAAGVVLFELLTRQRLFPGSSDFSILEKVRHAEVLPPTAIVPTLPTEVESVVLRALAESPEHRFPSASDMGDALVQVMLQERGHPTTVRELSRLMVSLFAEERSLDQRLLEESRQIRTMPEDVETLPTCAEVGPDVESKAPATPVTPVDPRTIVDPQARDAVEGKDVTPPGSQPRVEQTPRPAAELWPEPLPAEQPRSQIAGQQRLENDCREAGQPPPMGASDAEEAALHVPSAFGSNAHPTQIRSVLPRKQPPFRDILIIAAAVVIAGGLILGTWLATRSADPKARGGIVVISRPAGAEVVLDGVRVGVTPFSSPLPVGSKTLIVRKPGYASESRTVSIDTDRVEEVKLTLRASR